MDEGTERKRTMMNAINLFLKERHEKAWKMQEKISDEKGETKFRLAFDQQIVNAYRTACEHGWHDVEREDGTLLALIHSEISEAVQALRDGNPVDAHCKDFSSLEIELADAVIRIMDYAGSRNLDIAGAILAKMEYNRTRPLRHGGKMF